jgi:cell division protein FtsI (penicillin-binding protein 3)
LRRSGFGSAPDLPFPGVAQGLLRPVSRWSRIDQAALSYGYGTAVSLLQLARAYTQFGPSGAVLPLTLAFAPDGPAVSKAISAIESEVESDANKHGAPGALSTSFAFPAPADELEHSLALTPAISAEMRALLQSVAAPGGTAHRARVDGFVVGAKTGTTRKMGTHGYEKNEYLATAVGIVPVADPRFVVAVMIDRPQGKTRGGAGVAVPVLATVMQETLRLSRITPDYLSKVQDVQTD